MGSGEKEPERAPAASVDAATAEPSQPPELLPARAELQRAFEQREQEREWNALGPPKHSPTRAEELATLRAAVAALAQLQLKSVPPPKAEPEPRPSLPVQAVAGGYRLTRTAAAVLGILAALAELLSPEHGVVRYILRVLFERL